MKRLAAYDAPVLDDLLQLAALYDGGRFALDPYEIHELLNCLVRSAYTGLKTSSELRLGTVSLERDSLDVVTVRLKQRGLSVRKSCFT